jgi:hypothetical protein
MEEMTVCVLACLVSRAKLLGEIFWRNRVPLLFFTIDFMDLADWDQPGRVVVVLASRLNLGLSPVGMGFFFGFAMLEARG